MGGGLSLTAAATERQGPYSSATRSLVLASIMGVSMGGYVALEFFPGQTFLQVLCLLPGMGRGGPGRGGPGRWGKATPLGVEILLKQAKGHARIIPVTDCIPASPTADAVMHQNLMLFFLAVFEHCRAFQEISCLDFRRKSKK